jgi:DNA-binding GntR family transcriptional regulator
MEENLVPLDDLTVVKTVSLTNALEKQIERLIVEGELAPGERLNEIQLANRFGTSRGPLREATRSLEAKGFVEVIRNRGVFVRSSPSRRRWRSTTCARHCSGWPAVCWRRR